MESIERLVRNATALPEALDEVVLDGEFTLENGFFVIADGVALENMTARNYTTNGFFWFGEEGDELVVQLVGSPAGAGQPGEGAIALAQQRVGARTGRQDAVGAAERAARSPSSSVAARSPSPPTPPSRPPPRDPRDRPR